MDINIGIVNESTRLHVTRRIDVQITSPSRNTTLSIFTVIPKIHGKNGLCFTDFTNTPIHVCPLLRGSQKIGYCVLTHGYIGEIPSKATSPCDHVIHKLIGTNTLGVIAMVTSRIAKKQLMGTHMLHRCYNLAIGTLSTAHICGFLVTFYGKSK